MANHEAENGPSMTHEKHQPAHQHQMSPEMDKMGHDSRPPHASEKQNSEHQHKEHNQ
jgi:hypothetical protein